MVFVTLLQRHNTSLRQHTYCNKQLITARVTLYLNHESAKCVAIDSSVVDVWFVHWFICHSLLLYWLT